MMKDNVAFDINKLFGYPLKVKNRCGSKPDRGLDVEPFAPIGNTATPT
jgi:hypothetical protein